MDGSVEIELDHSPSPRGERGRRRRRDRPEASPSTSPAGAPDDATTAEVAVAPSLSTSAAGDAPPSGPATPATPATPDAGGVGGRRAAAIVGAVALVVAGFLAGRTSGTGSTDAADAAATTAATAPPTTRPAADRSLVTLPPVDASASGRTPVSTSPRPTTTPTTEQPPERTDDLGGPLVPTPTGVVVVGVTVDGDLAEVDLDRGLVRIVDVPGITRTSVLQQSVSVHVGATSSLVGSWDGPNLSVVPAGGTAAVLESDVWARAGIIGAGPGPDRFWVQFWANDPGSSTRVAVLDGSTGETVGEGLRLQGVQWGSTGPIGGTDLLLAGVGGTYRITSPSGGLVDDLTVDRITDGLVLGVGRDHVLSVECDDRLSCATFLIGRDGDGVALDVAFEQLGWPWSPASISPDGSRMAVRRWGTTSGLVVVDLATGEERTVRARPSQEMSDRLGVAWSADSGSLLLLSGGRLARYDVASDELVELDERLPSFAVIDARATAPGTGGQPPPPARR